MPDPRPAVLLDVDGTLLDTNYLHVLAWWQAFEDTGRGPVTMSAIHRAIGIPSDGLVRQLIGEDDEKTVDAHSRRYEPLRENVKPFPRTAELLRAYDEKSLDELGVEAARLAEAARGGTLSAEELRGSTFTVTSAGRLGGLFATPLVNHPEVAILGLHRIGLRAAVVEGQVVPRETGWLSCTFDHRVVDGARASEFLLAVIERLQSQN